MYSHWESENQLGALKYVMWRPYDESESSKKCYFDCCNEHYEVYGDEPVWHTILSYWQLIPNDINGNDILKLASDSSVLINSLHSE